MVLFDLSPVIIVLCAGALGVIIQVIARRKDGAKK